MCGMGARTVELEVVQYRTDEIIHASGRFIHNFVTYSGIEGTGMWGDVFMTIADIIQNQSDLQCTWRAQGLEITFTGFQPPIPTIRDERVVFSAREPRFIVEKTHNSDLLPSKRTHISRVTSAIAREMQDVYRLRGEDNPSTLIFPKQEYAKSIEVFNAAMLLPI